MRQQRPTSLVLAISLALFASATLAQSRAPAGARATVGSAPSTSATVGANAGNGISVGTGSNTNTGTQGSGPAVMTGTTGGNAVVIGVPSNSGTPSGTGVNGSTAGNTPAQGQATVAPGVVNPGVTNVQGRLVDMNGNLITDAGGNPLITDGRNILAVNAAGVYEPIVMGVDSSQFTFTAAPGPTTLVRISPELDRATRKELAKSKVAARSNRQLLNSITPRTNADRSDEVRDDPIMPRY